MVICTHLFWWWYVFMSRPLGLGSTSNVHWMICEGPWISMVTTFDLCVRSESPSIKKEILKYKTQSGKMQCHEGGGRGLYDRFTSMTILTLIIKMRYSYELWWLWGKWQHAPIQHWLCVSFRIRSGCEEKIVGLTHFDAKVSSYKAVKFTFPMVEFYIDTTKRYPQFFWM